jgi:hypothetical protein
MSARSGSPVTAALVVLFVTACGSDPAITSETPEQTVDTSPSSTSNQTTATTTTTATSTIATTTVPITTSNPTTLPATSVPTVDSGWSQIDPASVSSKAFPPCCADTWHGDVSPALVPAGQPLADGPYFVTMQWPDDPTQPLELEVFRFEQCALLPEYSCEPPPSDVEYSPTQLGVDSSASRPLAVALDDHVRVVVVGWDDGTLDDDRYVVEQANGTALAELAATVDQAYADVFAARFVAGEDPDAIVADVRANPTGGFSPAVNAFEGFVFAAQTGPPLLFQSAFAYVDDDQRVAGRGTDVLDVHSIDVVGGQVTVYVYAAYYS